MVLNDQQVTQTVTESLLHGCQGPSHDKTVWDRSMGVSKLPGIKEIFVKKNVAKVSPRITDRQPAG